jgi:hypothetical protein
MIRLLERRCPMCQELEPVGAGPRIEAREACRNCGHTLRPLAGCVCHGCARRLVILGPAWTPETLFH